jgi:hypothetical protein
MCDDAENLAGAGTDVRRCSDALGPRKNLQMYASLREKRLSIHNTALWLEGNPVQVTLR